MTMELTISIIAIFISVISLIVTVFTFMLTMRRDRKQATLDAYNELQEQVLDKLNLFSPKEIEKIAENNRSNEFKEISGYVARIEHFCVGVNCRIYNFKTVYELGHGYLDSRLKTQISPIINKKQSNTDFDYYANIHKVWGRMEKKSDMSLANEKR